MKQKFKKTYIVLPIIVILFLVPTIFFHFTQRNPHEETDAQTPPEASLQTEEESAGYSADQITAEMEKRYGDVSLIGKGGDLYCFDGGGFQFYVQNNPSMENNYAAEYFHYLTDTYFLGRTRGRSFEETGTGFGKRYIPVIQLNSSSHEEQEWFCSDVTEWLSLCLEALPYGENKELYTGIKIAFAGECFDYSFDDLSTLIPDVYNDLYEFIEQKLSDLYVKKLNDGSREPAPEDGDNTVLEDEWIQYYLTLEPDCDYETAAGIEYRMIPVDQAAGSRYYVLIAVEKGLPDPIFVNPDPYVGSGGVARWITFLEDGLTGFSCLSYSGGAYGELYRTENGGKSFTPVEYPSSMSRLPDGTYYLPFVMPERVYEENGKLYMEAGQGPNGDYYGEQGFCRGLYESEDNGRIWRYLKEIP